MKPKILALASALTFAGASLAVADLAALDDDGDGMLTMNEMLVAYPSLSEAGFTAIDANGDTMIDEAELNAAIESGILPAG